MAARRIPASGINLFQLIYVLIREYKEKTGLEPMNLSLGNPDGVPDQRLLDLQAKFAKDPAYDFHTYAEDKNLNRFAEGMVESHTSLNVDQFPHLRATPIAGIKTASALLPLACGLHLPNAETRKKFNLVSNLPAYDVIGTWSTSYLATNRRVWPLYSAENMRLNVKRLRTELEAHDAKYPEMIFVIRPGNPAAVGARAEEWKELIELCIERKIRLVNDGAYTALASANHVSLFSVAKDYPALEWTELFSVSKSFNDPGARLGAMVGSKDFIEDYLLIKGNTDSGPVPYLMAAYGEFFKNKELTREVLKNLQNLYAERLDYVVTQFLKAGFQKACDTDAGFFTLWKCPKSVLGLDLAKESQSSGIPLSELVNRKIISETGIVGVHFTGQAADGGPDPMLRYAVCTDVLNPSFQDRFESALKKLKVQY